MDHLHSLQITFLVSTISPLSSQNPKYCQTLLLALGGERSRSSKLASGEDTIVIAGQSLGSNKPSSASKPQPSVLAVVGSMSYCACAKLMWLSILYYYVSTITIQYLLSILLVYQYYRTTLEISKGTWRSRIFPISSELIRNHFIPVCLAQEKLLKEYFESDH